MCCCPLRFTEVVTNGIFVFSIILANQCAGILTPIVFVDVTASETMFLFFNLRINVYGPGSLFNQFSVISFTKQLSLIHCLFGAITENGLVSLSFIILILFTAVLFVASHPIP